MNARRTDDSQSVCQHRKRRAPIGAALSACLALLLVQGLFLIPTAEAITVGPAKIEYRVDPGQKVEGTFLVLNETNSKQTFFASFEKFTEIGGEKKFLPSEPSELANWFRMPKEVTLGPNEKKDIPFTIEVPNNAPPGGHFAVVWWGNAPVGGGKQVAIVTRAGALVYLQVSGDVRENGVLVAFQPAGGGRVFTAPPDFQVRFKNNGNTYLKPQGDLVIKNIFGKAVLSYKVNDVGRILLPEGEDDLRLTPQFTKKPFLFGFAKADLNLFWGEKPQTLNRQYIFFVFPLIPILVALIVLVGLFFALRIGLRKYRARIIADYAARQNNSPDLKQ